MRGRHALEGEGRLAVSCHLPSVRRSRIQLCDIIGKEMDAFKSPLLEHVWFVVFFNIFGLLFFCPSPIYNAFEPRCLITVWLGG